MSNNSQKKLTARKTGTVTRSGSGKKSAAELKRENRRSFWAQIIPYLLIVLAIVLVVCFFTGMKENPGVVVGFIYKTLTGLFGGMAFTIPLFIVVAAIMQLGDFGQSFMGPRLIYAGVTVTLGAAFLELVKPGGTFNVVTLFNTGCGLEDGLVKGGGVIGGLIGEAMLFCFKEVASFVIVIALFLLFVMLMLGFTPKYIYLYLSCKIAEAKEKKALEEVNEFEPAKSAYEPRRRRPPRKTQNDPSNGRQVEIEMPEVPLSEETSEVTLADPNNRKHVQDVDIEIDEGEPEPEESVTDQAEEVPEVFEGYREETEEERKERQNAVLYDEIMARSKSQKSRAQLKAEREVFGDGDFGFGYDEFGNEPEQQTVLPEEELEEKKIPSVINLPGAEEMFPVASEVPEKQKSDDDSIIDKFADDYEKGNTGEVIKKAKEVAKVKREYKFPDIRLLSLDKNKKSENIREELHDTADKLVAVLESFNVKTKLLGISRGPTITRYELTPEPGVRVKQVVNLVDDISLGLATTGVRIEAPIPGKPAIGVEVPNKSPNTVYLRELIESDEFQNSESKITSCLGKDVAGAPIIFDIKKMPHLLIAGATGMGKSVCINSILVSILYKATPEEVKLILIDPKKVEFVPYNGLPHLLVPVVTDPKKAAGTLQWAVNEMERRYALIEAEGVRDIKGYNTSVEEEQKLPQIVIVIDELADLMATASSEVETSIARIAAKARAAGMHLIIGTQRPSVDVITGVIKANVPSRIACTVASQTDSRTIIDRAGAESLIGRGDMLYNPVGAPKPMRVQGAFVSTEELDKIVEYIKRYNKFDEESDYDEDVIKAIDVNAQGIGVKKGSSFQGEGDSSDGEGDPLMANALEIAVESGKISTSLLQRRLSIGYGRAAKIIDRMQEKGYVSEPEGQKPREVLISKEQYEEMRLREETIE